MCTREDGLVSVLDIMKAGEAVRSARNTLQVTTGSCTIGIGSRVVFTTSAVLPAQCFLDDRKIILSNDMLFRLVHVILVCMILIKTVLIIIHYMYITECQTQRRNAF